MPRVSRQHLQWVRCVQQVDYIFTEFNRYNADRIDVLLASDADIKIAIVGDSRIRYGINPAKLQSDLEDQLGVRVAALTLTANRGTWTMLEAPLSSVTHKHGTLVVLIDDNMFAKEWTWLHDFRYRRDFAIWSVVGRGSWDDSLEHQIEMQSDLRCEGWLFTEESPEARSERVSEYFHMNPAGEPGRRATEFAAKLAASGTRVATVFIPAQPGGESMALRRPLDGMTLNVDFAPDPSLYCDTVHLNEHGREIFTRNLANTISQWLLS